MSWHTGERPTVVGGLILVIIFSFIYIVFVSIVWDFSTLRAVNGLPLAASFPTTGLLQNLLFLGTLL